MASKKKKLPPDQQPGSDVLSEINRITLHWIRGDMYSDQALYEIGEVVGQSEWFEGILESQGWKVE